MIIEPPDKGWMVHIDEDIDNACDEDGTWTAPEISTDHFVLDSDTAAFAYGKHFLGRVSVPRVNEYTLVTLCVPPPSYIHTHTDPTCLSYFIPVNKYSSIMIVASNLTAFP